MSQNVRSMSLLSLIALLALLLVPAAHAGTLSGRVSRAADGTGISGVSVQVYDADGGWATSGSTDPSGNYTTYGTLASGTYYVRTSNSAGYVDELYSDIPCPGWCSPVGGMPVSVTSGSTSAGIDFALVVGGRISGTVRHAATAYALSGVSVSVYDDEGRHVAWASTDAAGAYTTTTGLPTGSYFARTHNSLNYVDELYQDIVCRGCGVTGGTPIPVSEGTTTTAIDFDLDVGAMISGTVRDAATGAALASARVNVYTESDASCSWNQGTWVGFGWTDSSGAFSVGGLPTGRYYAETQHGSYVPQIYSGISCRNCSVVGGTPIDVTVGATRSGVDFALERGGSIAGTITDAQTGAAVTEVWLEVYDAGGRYATSNSPDAAGAYAVPGLPPGTYYVRARPSGGHIGKLYNGVDCQFCSVFTGTPIIVQTGQSTPVDFTLLRGGQVSGTIRDQATGNPLSNVQVNVRDTTGQWSAWGYTDGAGQFTTREGVPTGTYYASTWNSRGYINEIYDNMVCPSCHFASGTPISVAAGAVTPGIDFDLVIGGRIAGTVRDDATGQPVQNVPIGVYDLSGFQISTGWTDANGRYLSERGLPAGSYYLRANPSSCSRYVGQLYDGFPCLGFCSPSSGTPVSVGLGSTISGIDFDLARGSRIRGYVTDSVTAAPLSGVNVQVYTSSGSFAASGGSDGNGFYLTGAGLPTGTYYARTSNSRGYIDEVHDNRRCTGCSVLGGTPISVTGGTDVPLNFALSSGGRISGRITHETTGAALSNVSASIYNAGGGFVTSARTDWDGRYVSGAGLPTGTYHLRTSNSLGFIDEVYGGGTCPGCDVTTGAAISVTEGSTTPGIDLTLAPGARVAGTVTEASTGRPLANVSVALYTSTGAWVTSGRSDATGRYISDAGLVAGTYYARTANSIAYIDEVFDNIQCPNCYVTLGAPISVAAAGTVSGVDFALAPGGRVTGRVTDAFSGVPLSGAFVSVTGADGRTFSSARTDGNGVYLTTTGLPSGTYYARITNSIGYINELYNNIACSTSCNTFGGTPFSVTAGATTTAIDFAPTAGGRVQGTVRDEGTGELLAGVNIQVYDVNGSFVTSGTSDGSGRYITGTGLVAGTYYARSFSSNGYVGERYFDTTCQACSVTAGTPFTVSLGAVTTGIDFSVRKGARISGVVREDGTGKPLPFVGIDVHDSRGAIVTQGSTDGAGGFITGTGLLGGTYYVRANDWNYGHISELYREITCPACVVTAGAGVAVAGTATTSGIDFTLAPGGRIGGKITDGTGAPLTGISVSVYDESGRVVTNASTDAGGNYLTWRGVPTGTYYARTSNSIGYVNELYNDITCLGSCAVTVGAPISVTQPNTTSGIDFALALGGRISGNITDATTGAAISNVTAAVHDSSAREVTTGVSDGLGSYRTSGGLPTGMYYLRTRNSKGYLDETFDNFFCGPNCLPTTGTALSVTAGSMTSGGNFALTPGGRVSGTVFDGLGQPLAGITVALYDSAGAWAASASTNTSGVYTTGAGLDTGTYYARTRNSRGYVNHLYNGMLCLGECTVTGGTGVSVTRGATTNGVDFSLPLGGTVSGVLTDAATAQPLSNVTVSLHDGAGIQLTTGVSDTFGAYRTRDGLPGGTYYARTANSQSYINEVYNNRACITGCAPEAGEPITIVGGSDTPGISFALDLDGDPDGDGISTTIDRHIQSGADQSTIASDSFNDTPGGGLTTGTISARDAWTVKVTETTAGVRARISGSGAQPATIDACASPKAEQVRLDVAGEIADVRCEAAGSTTATAVLAYPVVQLANSAKKPTTVVDLTTGQTATVGSPVVASPSNTEPIRVRFEDALGNTFGWMVLDPGERVDVTFDAGAVNLVVNEGTVEANVEGTAATLSRGQAQSLPAKSLNQPPAAQDDSFTVEEDSRVEVASPGVLGNDSDPDGSSLGAVIETLPQHGQFALLASGALAYTPYPNFHGVDRFTYRASDGSLVSSPAAVTITVTPVNDAPVARPGPDQILDCGGYTTAVILDGSASSDVDGDPLSHEWRDATGTVVATGPRTTVSLGVGRHTLELVVRDPHGAGASAPVTIEVRDRQPPVLALSKDAITVVLPMASASGAAVDLSGVASASDGCDSAPQITHDAPAIFPVGSTVVTFRAADASGNVSEATLKVTVAYLFEGFLAPIGNDGSSVFRSNRVVPVKFILRAQDGTRVAGATATVHVFKVTDSVQGTREEAAVESAGESNTDNFFRYDAASGQYVYNLKTTAYTEGTYILRAASNDGTVHDVTISIRN